MKIKFSVKNAVDLQHGVLNFLVLTGMLFVISKYLTGSTVIGAIVYVLVFLLATIFGFIYWRDYE